MAIAGLIVTILVASGTWIFTQRQARTAARRSMRINYLLDAYRRLDTASNRPLNPATTSDLEAAVSDIILLGSPAQVALAEQLAKAFASEHVANTGALLQDLRASLRRELLLERLPRFSYVSLRITDTCETAPTYARIWRETAETTRQAIANELAAKNPTQPLLPEDIAHFETASPMAIIAASYGGVEKIMRILLADATSDDLSTTDLPQLTNRALERHLIDHKLADSLNGLSSMRILTSLDQANIDYKRAREFLALATAILTLIREKLGITSPTEQSAQTDTPNGQASSGT